MDMLHIGRIGTAELRAAIVACGSSACRVGNVGGRGRYQSVLGSFWRGAGGGARSPRDL